jgi:hypothetical protein
VRAHWHERKVPEDPMPDAGAQSTSQRVSLFPEFAFLYPAESADRIVPVDEPSAIGAAETDRHRPRGHQ